MTPLFPAQRAAEEFDQVLGGTAPPAAVDRHAASLEAVAVLRAEPEVLPRAEFVADLRSRLMTAASTELTPAPLAAPSGAGRDRPRRIRSTRRVGTLAASLVIVGGSAGMAAAASGAVPGDALYPLKRGVERAGTAVHVTEAGKGRTLLGQGANRLDEVQKLQSRGSPDVELVDSTVDSFVDAVAAGSTKLFADFERSGDEQDIEALRTFAAQQMETIGALSGISDTTDATLLDAADKLTEIDQQARILCESCGSTTPLTPPGSLTPGTGAAAAEGSSVSPGSPTADDVTEAARPRDAAEAAAAGKPPANPALEEVTDQTPGAQAPVAGKPVVEKPVATKPAAETSKPPVQVPRPSVPQLTPGLGNGGVAPDLPTPGVPVTGTPTTVGKTAPPAPVNSPAKPVIVAPVTVVTPPVVSPGTTPAPQVGGTEAGVPSTTAP
jgi:hypothetical protein